MDPPCGRRSRYRQCPHATLSEADQALLEPVFKDHRIVDHGVVIRRHELTDREWEVLAPLILRAATGRPRVEDRQVVNGMAYKIRTGISWRDLPCCGPVAGSTAVPRRRSARRRQRGRARGRRAGTCSRSRRCPPCATARALPSCLSRQPTLP
ncbi:transposase [Streptomyces sp. NPDC060053]|uniref:transposase n=1 Tax=Streptomyces sp. NPDC060053 TaxID=3347047 RepID=UPI0036BD789F